MNWEERVKGRIAYLYEDEGERELAWDLLKERLDRYDHGETVQDREEEAWRPLTEADTMLITYGDTIRESGGCSLDTLHRFLAEYVGKAIGHVHLLPMYPYTSDDGFSVVDYRAINPELGDWPQVHALAEDYGLMYDAVINHISRSSDWFQAYLRCEEPYTDYFITCDPKADYHMVTRPRTLPLLTKVETSQGEKYVWTTFSTDQIDLNAACPQVLAELADLLVFYARSGAKFIRLDAIGFLWKELGTTCMHHPKTHEAIRLFKDVLQKYAPGTRIITETNVPQKENLSYFGENGEEADLVYQFPLPPLTMYTMLTGNASVLSKWLDTQRPPHERVTFFNFLSSHDGIGVRPVEGILTEEQRQLLVDQTLRSGGKVSWKDNGDGTVSPYELNINYQDALAGPDDSDEVRIGRFLAAETILLSLQGMPAIYIHSLLGSRNDYAGLTESGQPRRINREKLSYGYVREQLDGDTNRGRIFSELIRRLNIRRTQGAFAPGAAQEVKNLDTRVFCIRRGGPSEAVQDTDPILVLINVSGETVELKLSGFAGRDLLSEGGEEQIREKVMFSPYQARWIREERSADLSR